MKTVIRSVMIALALSMFTLTGAFADTPQQELNTAVQEAALECSSGEIKVVLNEGVATLSGQLDCAIGRVAAQKAAEDSEYVSEVINLITVK